MASARNIPHDRHYDRIHHVWAKRDGGRVRIGIDTIGLESLGELAFIAFQPVGTKVFRGQPVGTLEAAKMTTSIAAPISGTLVAVNDAARADPQLVNESPYAGGWLVEIEPASWDADAAELVSGDEIEDWVASELERLETEQQ